MIKEIIKPAVFWLYEENAFIPIMIFSGAISTVLLIVVVSIDNKPLMFYPFGDTILINILFFSLTSFVLNFLNTTLFYTLGAKYHEVADKEYCIFSIQSSPFLVYGGGFLLPAVCILGLFIGIIIYVNPLNEDRLDTFFEKIRDKFNKR